jgi:hypothetical protein
MSKRNKEFTDEEIAAFTKGQYISSTVLRERFDIDDVHSPEYSFALMALQARIERMRKDTENPVVARTHRHGIRILPDNDAAHHLGHSFDLSVNKMKRIHTKGAWVDPTNLTVEENKTHQKKRAIIGLSLQAIETERRRARVYDDFD